MFGLLLALLIIDGLLLGVIVLLQAGKGGGLASMGGGAGTDTLIGGRQAATILTKATWVTGGLFMGLALILSVLSTRSERPESILRGEFQQQQQAPPPVQLPGTEPQAPAQQGPGSQVTPGTQPQGTQQPPANNQPQNPQR